MCSIVESKLNSQYFQHIVLNDSSCVVISFQSCQIYLCGTKYDMVQSDKKLRQVDYHVTTDYADGE